jgi:excisionase family DNA binding protein
LSRLSGADKPEEIFGVNERGQQMKSHDILEISSRRFFDVEPFVDADVAAEFLSVKRKTILDWARAGVIPAHRYGRGNKAVWRFRISEIASHGQSAHSTMAPGSPDIARLEKK